MKLIFQTGRIVPHSKTDLISSKKPFSKKELETLSETFTQDFIPTKTEKQIQVENTVAVKLKFDRQAAFRVYDEFTDIITEDYREIYMSK